MKAIISILGLCFLAITSHSQIVTSDKFEFSSSAAVYPNEWTIETAPDLIESGVVLKFSYHIKKRTVTAQVVNLQNFSIESEKTLVLKYKDVAYSFRENWCIHAKEYSYLAFKVYSGKEGKLIYYTYNRKSGEFLESIIEVPCVNSKYDKFSHVLSPDSTLIARMIRKDNGTISPVNGNIIVDVLDVEQNLKLVRRELFEDKMIPAEEKGDYLTGLNFDLEISNEGKIAMLKSIAIYRKAKPGEETYHLLFRSDVEGNVNQNLLKTEFNAQIFHFSFDKERLVMAGIYNTATNLKQYKGYFITEFNRDLEVVDTKFTDFPSEFHTNYYSTETDDFKDDPSKEEGHIHSIEITQFKQLSDGNYFVVCEKIYNKYRSQGSRRHNQNVYISMLSPEFEIVKNFVIPKYLYDSNYGRGTINSEVLIGEDHIFVFTQEDREVKLPKNEKEAINLTRAAITSPNYVCYRINIQNESIERYALFSIKFNENKFEFFPKEVFINENEEIFSWMFFPDKKGKALFKITLN